MSHHGWHFKPSQSAVFSTLPTCFLKRTHVTESFKQHPPQDYTRTGTYYAAILGNPDDFRGRVVMDVGAGSGILSLFAAQAGAARVYAVEASAMARFARMLADANPALGSRITVINSKVEEVQLQGARREQ